MIAALCLRALYRRYSMSTAAGRGTLPGRWATIPNRPYRTATPQPESPEKPPPTITNSIGMKLVLIPAGGFLMGSPPAEPLG